jgi:hypothetical protein
MPLCGNLILREHSTRTSGSVTLRREVVSSLRIDLGNHAALRQTRSGHTLDELAGA